MLLFVVAGFLYFQHFTTFTRNKILGYLPQLPKTTPQPQNNWKTYTDEIHGFSLQYPDYWVDKSVEYLDYGEPSGIAVHAINAEKCTTADNYFREEILPSYPDIKKAPISNPNLDGFIIKERHLDYVTPGPEAYVMNCPYVIRLGFNPTGINYSKDVFDEIISSFKTWEPKE